MQINLSKVQIILEWVKTQLFLDSQAINAKNRAVKRGQVYRCNFGVGVGSEMQKDRPCVIIQNNIGNMKSGNTIVIPITHDTSTLPCVVPITPQRDVAGTVILDGQTNASNILCVSKARLGDLICNISPTEMKLIDESIAKTLGIMKYYADIKAQLDDKLQFISKIKAERNTAQDCILQIREILQIHNTLHQPLRKQMVFQRKSSGKIAQNMWGITQQWEISYQI
ncbi:MAG: type II toxin-antitoxin system PemK/MazF family toxin [Lachnospiraceae bacterium]